MKVTQDHNQVIVEGIRDFNLKHTFECGQCFRWSLEQDGSYTGIAFGRVVNAALHNDIFIIKNTNMQDFQNIWRRYFDLDRDYGAIKTTLSHDRVLKEAVDFGWGMRILQQEIWECLISFIISSNNIIPRIKKIINSISEKYGKPVSFEDHVYYSFPRPEDLYGRTVEDLAFCRSGYRCSYILDAARSIVEGEVDLKTLSAHTISQARKVLMSIKGIGPKVADCILLYSVQKYDSFPTDVWVKRVMQHLYLGDDASIGDVQRFSNEQYGGLAGFAQQYLFYYAREQKIGR